MPDVFISYAREDCEFARSLASALEQRGFSVWWDWDLIGGTNYRARIREVIAEAKKAVVLWSKNSVTSGFVLDEATEAKKLGKLIPASIDGSEPPLGFGDLHTITLNRPDQDLAALIAALHDQVITRRPLPIPRRHVGRAIGASLILTCLAPVAGGAYWFYARSTNTGPIVEPQQHFTGPRLAYVVGNRNYGHLGLLDNPERDAAWVSETLEHKGFKVVKQLDLDRAELIRAVEEFESTLSIVGGVGFFYYAGRAAYIDDQDILLPVDAVADKVQSKIVGGVNFTQLTREVQAKTTQRMTDNGYAVIYSASKGQVAADGPPGGNSPFTKKFVDALSYPEDELNDLFRRIGLAMEGIVPRQTPFFEDSRKVRFYFNKPDQDARNGIIKILVFDSCRDNPFKLSVATK
jgi:hypothetical protein